MIPDPLQKEIKMSYLNQIMESYHSIDDELSSIFDSRFDSSHILLSDIEFDYDNKFHIYMNDNFSQLEYDSFLDDIKNYPKEAESNFESWIGYDYLIKFPDEDGNFTRFFFIDEKEFSDIKKMIEFNLI